MQNCRVKPSVLVVLPTHNGETFLPAALESLLNQSYTNFGLLIIDDGSTDESAIIINAYLSAFSERMIKVFVETNYLNCGLWNTYTKVLPRYVENFDFFLLFGHDDILQYTYIEKVVKCAERNESEAVFTRAIGINKLGKIESSGFTPIVSIASPLENFLNILRSNVLPSTGTLIRSYRFEKLEIKKVSNILSDWALWLEITFDARLSVCIHTNYFYRQHQESITQKWNYNDIIQEWKKLLEEGTDLPILGGKLRSISPNRLHTIRIRERNNVSRNSGILNRGKLLANLLCSTLSPIRPIVNFSWLVVAKTIFNLDRKRG